MVIQASENAEKMTPFSHPSENIEVVVVYLSYLYYTLTFSEMAMLPWLPSWWNPSPVLEAIIGWNRALYERVVVACSLMEVLRVFSSNFALVSTSSERILLRRSKKQQQQSLLGAKLFSLSWLSKKKTWCEDSCHDEWHLMD